MSNPGALSSAGAGGGVQVQADITGITQFLLNIGIAGFKHHALAGVDTHTILSMLSISEVCPASMPCRMRLTQKRNEQRRQSVWLYKIVEVGAGTNFIVDQLLSTRAGENIMAMMSGLAPVLSKAAFNTAALHVFQKRNVPSDSIPGLTQLEKFRDTILPLASGMDIKDKVFQYHKWMTQLSEPSSTPTTQQSENTDSTGPNVTMPDAETIATVICYLSRLMEQQDEAFVLVYHGQLGAAWVAAYAQDILGLSVCTFVNENSTVPLSGDSLSARVILRLHSQKGTCELRRVGKVEDFIKIQSLPAREETGWIVDARTTKYYSPQRSTSNGSRDHIYNTLARSLTSDYMQSLAMSLNQDPSDRLGPGIKKFAVARLALLRKRAFSNMQILGFDCTTEVGRSSNWRLYFTVKSRGVLSLVPSKLWKEKFGDALVRPDVQSVDSVEFNSDGRDAIDFLMKAVNFATTLAFTNWGQPFCYMSVRYLESSWRGSWLSEETRPLLYRDPKSIVWHDPTLEMLLNHDPVTFNTTDLLRYAISVSTSIVDYADIRRFLDPANDLIAVSCEGLVLARTMSMSDIGALRQVELLSIFSGAIVCEGESLASVKSELPVLELSAELVTNDEKMRPSNAVENLRVVSRSLIERREVLVETLIMLGTECCQVVDAVAISEMIPQILISDSCPHDYYNPYHVPQRIRTTDTGGEKTYRAAPVWQGGLSFQSKARPESMRAMPASMKIYVQHVDRNPLGQWLACQWTSDWHSSAVILQEDSCLECIFRNARKRSFVEICIINGGTGTTRSRDSTSHVRSPSQHQAPSSSDNSRRPPASGQGPSTIRTDPSVSHDVGREKSDDRPMSPQIPSGLESVGSPTTEENQRRSWKLFGRPKQKKPS